MGVQPRGSNYTFGVFLFSTEATLLLLGMMELGRNFSFGRSKKIFISCNNTMFFFS
jgi:hypothetical protein